MPRRLSAIGFPVRTEKEFFRLAHCIADKARVIPTASGHYLRWSGSAGEELWVQVDRSGYLVGMNPHFSGKSRIALDVIAKISRAPETSLDGAIHAWAVPTDEASGGAYAFVFDAPDFHAYQKFTPPGRAVAQIAAFPHEIAYYETPAHLEKARAIKDVKVASKSFVPSGLFTDGKGTGDEPSSMAVCTGHVLTSSIRKNKITKRSFYWALVETSGGTFDVVIDPRLLPQLPAPGGILSGTFWLSGRILSFPNGKRSWFRRLLKGGENNRGTHENQ